MSDKPKPGSYIDTQGMGGPMSPEEAKNADKYYEFKDQEKEFTLADLYRVERIHYYDNSYNMSYIPERFESILSPLIHDSRSPAVRSG